MIESDIEIVLNKSWGEIRMAPLLQDNTIRIRKEEGEEAWEKLEKL